MRRMRTVTPVLPAETGRRDGLAYNLWLPREPTGGIVIVHGADSCKESHYDFARAALALRLGAITFDQRGHAESDGPIDAGAIDDVAAMATRLREALGGDPSLPIALRGTSMGGYLVIRSAPAIGPDAVVAICPASGEGLRRGLREDTFGFAADRESLDAFLAGPSLHEIVPELTMPLLLMHAEGDERVPVEHSRELAALVSHPDSRLIAVPGGHHRSIQHDEEMQAISLRFITRAFGRG
jgi:alpha-beta hydrolase superfamily lysophospholipase